MMVRKIILAFGGAAALAAIASPGAAATQSFVQDFNNAQFDFIEYKPAGYDTSITYSDGVGRAIRYTYDHVGPNPTALRFQALSQSFVYDPSVQGTINSIGAAMAISSSYYGNGVQVNLATLQDRLRLLARQDGKIYEAIGALSPGGTFGTYQTKARTGFTAADFLLFDPANPNAARTLTGLDFAGSAITFGFELTPLGTIQSNGQPVQGRTIASTDVNLFTVDVDYTPSLAAVPEPAQWALLIGGFGMMGAAARGRRAGLRNMTSHSKSRTPSMTRRTSRLAVGRATLALGTAVAVAAPAHAALLDPGFELQGASVGSSCYLNNCPAGAWSGSGAGLQDEGNTDFPGIATPDGAKYGFVQAVGSLSQTFVADLSGQFRLSFLDAGRPRAAQAFGGDQNYQVRLDAVSLGNFATTSGQAFTARVTDAFSLIAGQSYTLTFAGQSVNDNTAYIDALSFDAVAPGGVPEPAAWALMIGGFGIAGTAARRHRQKILVAV